MSASNPGSEWMARLVTLAPMVVALALACPSAHGQSGPPARPSLEQFASQVFIHGVPYEEVVAYGPSAVPALIRMLQDAAQESRWLNASIMLAMIGDPRGIDAVTAFIRSPGDGELTATRHWIRGNALMALGYSAHGARNRAALQYLQASLEPGAWAQRGVRGARPVTRAAAETEESAEEIEATTDGSLTEWAAAGLALSGTPEGRQALLKHRGAPGRSAADLQRIDSLLAEHETIARIGVGAYDRERHARLERARPQGRGIDEAAPAPAADAPPPPDDADSPPPTGS